MPTNSRQRSTLFSGPTPALVLAVAASCGCLCGCAGSEKAPPRVNVADFAHAPVEPAEPVDGQAAGAAEPPVSAPRRRASSDTRVVTIVPVELDEVGTLATRVSGPPRKPSMTASTPAPSAAERLPQSTGQDAPPARAPAPGPVVPIDGLVGHINGQPVYASEMFSDLRGRMDAEAAKAAQPDDWKNAVGPAVANKLRTRVESELILAESRESLTPEQRKGLIFALQEIQASLVREQGGGSALRAEQRLLQGSQPATLEEAAAERLDEMLVIQELRAKVSPRIHVSQRDVRLRYLRDFESYNPPNIARFLVIRVLRESTEFDEVQARLAAGEPFAEVAAEPFNKYPAGGEERPFRGDQSEATFFYGPAAPLNGVARKLEPGQQEGPIDLGDGTAAWVRLDSLEEPDATPLYEAQLAIESQIRKERETREIQRYVARLRSKGSFTSENQMIENLLLIGANQHLIGREE